MSAGKDTSSSRRAADRETVLLAVVGFSPAVLTETVWALAHPARGKPVVPHRVIALTTAPGREAIRRELLDSGVWERLRETLRAKRRLEFGDTGTHIRVITRGAKELDDLRTPEDNVAAADFILEELRKLVENPDLQVIASIAGGRKTMSVLLYAAMCLIGRPTDRITHVLVSEELEQRREPKFYFPQNARERAEIRLAEIPFVPLRNVLARELGRMPGRFSALVSQYRGANARVQRPPIKLQVRTDRPEAIINGVRLLLSAREHLLLLFLADSARQGLPPWEKYCGALEPLGTYRAKLSAQLQQSGAAETPSIANIQDDQDLRKVLSGLTRKLRQLGPPAADLVQVLPRRGHFALDLPPKAITITP